MAAPVPPYAYSQLMDMYLIQLQYQQQETALAAKQHGTSDVMCLEWPTRYTLYSRETFALFTCIYITFLQLLIVISQA